MPASGTAGVKGTGEGVSQVRVVEGPKFGN